MKPIHALLLGTTLCHADTVLIGTRTDGDSKGIYAAEFDPKTGQLSRLRLAAEADSPGFLALHPRLQVVYATGRNEVAAYSYRSNGSLTLLKRRSSGGNGPCHLEVDPTGRILAVANYGAGTVSWFPLGEDGTLLKKGGTFRHTGNSTHPTRQEAPHAHGTHFNGSLLVVPDLGTDELKFYEIGDGPTLVPSEMPPVKTQPGDGPRHATFSPDGKHAFVIHELSSIAEAYRITPNAFESTSRASTLPADWSGTNTTAEIEVHPSGSWVLASNRGHDSIAVFSFDAESGKLTPSSIVPCIAEIPRHFKIAPGGKWVLVAGQKSDDIHGFSFDAASGKLEPTGKRLAVPAPICITFLPSGS